jgi:3-oxoacyl-[acyl-carrier-protein] synthase II
MRFAITGLGVVSPAGVGQDALFEAIATGRAAPLSNDEKDGLSARVGDFGAKQQIPASSLRRMPRMTQMAIVAAKQALAEQPANWVDPTRVGVILGTGLGTLDETIGFMQGYIEGGPEAASPLLFPYSVMNAAAGQMAVELKLRGINSTVNHRDTSPLSALGMACDLLELGRADAILVGGVDELSAPVRAGYRLFGAISRSRMRPYDAGRDGLVPGEGASIIVLEREEDARRRGARVRAIVDGRAESGESRPRIGWGHEARWPDAERAIAEVVRGRAISWMSGQGNGSSLDERELHTVKEALGALPPTSSILPVIGETMSSGMMRICSALFALEKQTLPGTPGLSEPPAGFAAQLVRDSRAADVERVLVASFAQGGANAAVVLERP